MSLERCPFCGGPGELFGKDQRPGCPDPECAGNLFFEDDAAITVEMWNRRPGKLLTVRYSCGLCGLLDVEVGVPARTPDLDVVAWTVSRHHSLVSPGCRPKEIQNIKIPVDAIGSEGIGFPVEPR